MKKTEIRQKIEELTEAIKNLITESTDEVVAEHVEELIDALAEEAISNHYGLLEDEDLDLEENSDEPIDFFADMDKFSDD